MAKYHMIVSHEHKFAYYPVIKTGTTSVSKFLTKNYNASIEGRCAFQGRHVIYTPVKAKEYFKFTTVRSPYARAFSLWKMQETIKPNNSHETFKDFINDFLMIRHDWHSLSMAEVLRSQLSLVKFLKFLKLENIDSELLKLPFVNPVHLPIPELNVTKAEREYSEECFDLVKVWAKYDFDLFGYSLDVGEHFSELQRSD